MDGTILVADDDRTIRTVLTQALTRAGCRVHATGSMQTLLRWVEEGKGDLVISDVIMPDGNGLETLPRIRKLRPSLPVIIISAQNTIMTAIQASEARAHDYLPKPFDLPDLMKRAAKALEVRRPANPAAASALDPPLPAPEAEQFPLIGRSPAMQELYRLVAKVMNSPLPVLVTGESGTGKSLIAQTLHQASRRGEARLIQAEEGDLDTSGGLAALLNRGAGGSVLIEEISELRPEAQARLARAIDGQREGRVRLLATSQSDLSALVQAGRFRQDLFYRFSAVTLTAPPLRDRLEDIALLAQHFLARAQRDGGAPRSLAPEALQALRVHPWPGNVRELENLIRRLALIGSEASIGRAEIEAALGPPRRAPVFGDPGQIAPAAETLRGAMQRHLQRYFDLHEGALPPSGLYDRILREVEVPLIEISLEATGGNQLRAAELLGLNRNTLRKKIQEGGISTQRRRRLG